MQLHKDYLTLRILLNALYEISLIAICSQLDRCQKVKFGPNISFFNM